MVNSDLARGTVVFGIEADGNVYGVEQGNLDTAQRSLSQAVRDRFDPKLVVTIEVEELNDRNEAMKKTYRCRCGGEFWPAT